MLSNVRILCLRELSYFEQKIIIQTIKIIKPSISMATNSITYMYKCVINNHAYP